jgi:ubiquitin-protein ligase E3 C
LISGSAQISLDDLAAHTHYAGGYSQTHEQIRWLWEILRDFDETLRQRFLHFATSCARAPLLGFKALSPRFAIQRTNDDSDASLPTASTCMNLLRLPRYSSKERLREKLTYAITSNAGFALS